MLASREYPSEAVFGRSWGLLEASIWTMGRFEVWPIGRWMHNGLPRSAAGNLGKAVLGQPEADGARRGRCDGGRWEERWEERGARAMGG
eukprot:9477765-Pyramimonas_sp.AAC.4